MIRWLLDTNVISELRRPKPEPRVVTFVAAQPLECLYLSAVTLAEIRFGIGQQPEAGTRASLANWLTHKVRPMFAERILPVSEDILVTWRLLVEQGRKSGYTFSQPDLFIAATAQQHGLTVVSRDVTDYMRAGVSLFNPWTDSAVP